MTAGQDIREIVWNSLHPIALPQSVEDFFVNTTCVKSVEPDIDRLFDKLTGPDGRSQAKREQVWQDLHQIQLLRQHQRFYSYCDLIVDVCTIYPM